MKLVTKRKLKNGTGRDTRISTNGFQSIVVILFRNPTRQLKELKNAITIKALKVSADEVQDVIASRLIPMVQERENLIDSGKSAAANVH